MGAVNPIHYSLRVTTCAVIVKHIKGIGQYNMLLYRLLSKSHQFSSLLFICRTFCDFGLIS